MISKAPIVARLKAAGCLRVMGVIEYGAQTTAPQLPAHFVAPVDESAAPNRLSGIVDQLVTETFQVVIVIAAQAARADRPSEELETASRRVTDALVGWTHPECSRPIEYAGGRLLSAGGREVVWSARFKASYHLRT